MNDTLNALCPMFVQFAAVAREGQITRAAAALDVPQPTVTRHLARLESVVGVRLFTRVSGGIVLTPEGEGLREPVEKALTLLENGLGRLEAGRAHRRVALGFLHTLGEETVPSLLRHFGEIAPGVTFSLVQDSADQLLRRLADGRVELCVTAPLPASPEVTAVRLGVQRLVLAVPERHPLAHEPEITLAAAASDEFVTLEPHNYMRQMADGLCRAAGFEPRIAFEATGVSTLRGLVATGLGVAIVPAGPYPVTGVVEVPLTDDGAFREIGLAWRPETGLSRPAERFRRFVIDWFADRAAEPEGDTGEQAR